MASNTTKKVTLVFEANTQQAMRNTAQLNNLLHQISRTTRIDIDNGSIEESVNAARELQRCLSQAMDMNTGKLDLSAFNQSLKQSGTSVQELSAKLQALGPNGQQAFILLANSIAQAEAPLLKVNKTLQNFLTTLANTAKWQLSSTIVHGLVGTLQSATGHAKSLNSALTDIQIVTNYTSKQMAEVAKHASEAALALNTTTTEYAKAALIFYQQGLSGSEVEERANVVVKLAQVTGQSASMVSDQMTAIWNNFDNGRHSLEYYADGIAKLGAATAASTDEISDALQRFAAIADTVGLSYEMASAAVATIIDKTKQSADIVGTSLKTVFARMESLSLGDTLEDGVTLTKYSKALEDVGVHILDTDGKLKDMDLILSLLGNKWDDLGRETQIALAQTVGGVRQYNQVMALMNNWEDVQKNMQLAAGAMGTLNEQQSIYAHSYEASEKRLEKAKKDLYETFVNDDILISINDIFTKLINGVNNFIQRMGGIKQVVLTIAGALSGVLMPLLTKGLSSVGQRISQWSGKTARDLSKMRADIAGQIQGMVDSGALSSSMAKQMQLSQRLLEEKNKLIANSKHMTEAEKAEAEARLLQAQNLAMETQALLEQQHVLEQAAGEAKTRLTSMGNTSKDVRSSAKRAFEQRITEEQYNAQVDDENKMSYGDISHRVHYATNNSRSSIQDKIAETETQLASQKRQADSTRQRLAMSLHGEVHPGGKEAQAAYAETEERLKEEEAIVKELEKQAEFYKEIAKLQEDINFKDKVTEDTTFGRVAGPAAGETEGDYMSSRVGNEDKDQDEYKAAYSIENEQMRNVANSFDNGQASFSGDGGALEIETSIANYEKLYEILGKQQTALGKLQSALSTLNTSYTNIQKTLKPYADTADKLGKKIEPEMQKKLQGTYKELKKGSKEYKQLTKDQQKYVDALQDLDKAQNASMKQMQNQKAAYVELAKQNGLTGDSLEELEKAFDNLDKGGEEADAAFKTITNTFNTLGQSTAVVKDEVVIMADTMFAKLEEVFGQSPELDALRQKFAALANTMPAVQTSIDNTANAFDRLHQKHTSTFQTLTKGMTTLATFTMQAQAAYGAIEAMGTAWAEDAGPMETVMHLFTLISTIIPTVNTLMEMGTIIKELHTKATQKANAAKVAEIAAVGVETGAKWSLTAANIAVLASNPWTFALVAVVIALIVATSIAISKQREQSEKLAATQHELTDAQDENAKSTMASCEAHADLMETWLEEMKTMDALIAKYKQLSAAEREASGITDDILAQRDTQVNAYENLYANTKNLTKEQQDAYFKAIKALKTATTVDEVANATADLDAFFAEVSPDQLDSGMSSAAVKIASDLTKGAEGKYTADSNYLYFDRAYQDEGGTDHAKVQEVLESTLKGLGRDHMLKKGGVSGNGIESDYWVLQMYAEGEELIADYEALMAAKDALEQQVPGSILSTDTMYNEICNILSNSADAYKSYKSLQGTKMTTEIVAAASSGNSNLRNITNYQDFLNNRKQVNGAGIEGLTEEELNDFYRNNETTAIYQQAYDQLDKLQEKGVISDQDAKVLSASLTTEADVEMFANLRFDKYQTLDAVQEAMKIAKDEAKREEIDVKIGAYDSALDTLKAEGNTEEEWEQIRDGGADFSSLATKDSNGNVIKSGFENFLAMTYEEQKAFLEGQKQLQEDLWISNAEAQIESINTRLDATSSTLTEAERKVLEQDRLALEEELAIRKEILKVEEIQSEGLPVDEVKAYVEALKEAGILTGTLVGSATDMATASFKLQRGLTSLHDEMDGISKALVAGNEGTIEYTQALSSLKSILSDILNIDTSKLSADFLTNSNNIALLLQAANGNADALMDYQQKAAEDYLYTKYGVSRPTTQQLWDTNDLDFSSYKTGDTLSAEILDNFKERGLEGDALTDYLSVLGFTYDGTNAVYNGASTTALQDWAKAREKEVFEADPDAYLNLNDEVDKYYDYNDAISKAEKSLDKLAKSKERAYGASYLALLDQEIEGIQDSIDKQGDLADKIDENMETARASLKDDYDLRFNDDGSFANYDDIVAAEVAKYNQGYDTYAAAMSALDTEYNTTGMADEEYERRQKAIEEEWEAKQKAYEDFQKATEEYSADYDLAQSTEEALQDLYDQLSAANLEKITYALEVKLDIDTRDLEWLDYKLEAIGEDFYSKIEAVKILVGEIGEDGSLSFDDSKIGIAMNNLSTYQGFLDELDARSTTLGEDNYMSDVDYKAGLESLYDATMNDISAMRELDNTMLSYYSETMSMATEELAQYTERMEHHTAVLDHYSNLMGIIGEEENYEAMGVILEGQAHVLENALTVSSEAHAVYAAEAENWKAKMNEALASGDEAAFKIYEENWKSAEATARESQDKMLSDLAAWAEAEKAILENTMKDLNKTLENALTGGTTFDELSTSMERAASLQEEYLTTTNKVYETTKMIRTAQQAIDASTNTAAKNKLKNFMTETKALQEQGKLSKFELEMQQEKYNLLVAEIALEEAQNAKSTVRLQRDSEGNFGYVYTADSKAVSAAEQQYEDAQNALYNKGLEAANGYTDKYKSTMQEMYDTLTSLNEQYMNGQFESEEEYNAAVSAAKEYYYQQLQDYSHLYQVALTGDSAIVAEAWSTDFSDMIENTDAWKRNIDGYLSNSSKAFEDWDAVIAKVKETTGGNLSTLANNVGSIVSQNDELTKSITKDGGVLDKMDEQLKSVGAVAAAYAVQRKNILDTIAAYEEYAKTVGDKIDTIGNNVPGDDTDDDTNNTTNSETPDSSSDNNTSSTGSEILDYILDTVETIAGPEAAETVASAMEEISDLGVSLYNGVKSIFGFDTGGYTGAWGSGGKLAMLHEKELVLNKHDTENLLLTIDTLRGILSTIDSYALNQQLGGIISSPGYMGGNQAPMEQNVHIEASFPGVVDRNEIEEAFNNLVNKASQYANRQ